MSRLDPNAPVITDIERMLDGVFGDYARVLDVGGGAVYGLWTYSPAARIFCWKPPMPLQRNDLSFCSNTSPKFCPVHAII